MELDKMTGMSDLPHELLGNIGKCLNTKIDVSRFRAVCRSWRSSIPPFEKQKLDPIRIHIDPPYDCFSDDDIPLSEIVVYHVEPPPPPAIANVSWGGWVVRVKESGELCKVKTPLLHPLSPSHPLKRLPPMPRPMFLNLLNFRVFELAKFLRLISLKNKGHVSSYRVAMSSNSDCPALMFVAYDGALYHKKLGVDDEKCSLVYDTISYCSYRDVKFYQGKFVAVAKDGRAVVVDSSLKLTTIASPVDDGYGHHKALIESPGELLLVDRYIAPYEVDKDDTTTRQFRVYKLNAVEKQWVEVESLGDRILFVGADCNFSASAQDLPGFQGNCLLIDTSLIQSVLSKRHRGPLEKLLDAKNQLCSKFKRRNRINKCPIIQSKMPVMRPHSFISLSYPSQLYTSQLQKIKLDYVL